MDAATLTQVSIRTRLPKDDVEIRRIFIEQIVWETSESNFRQKLWSTQARICYGIAFVGIGTLARLYTRLPQKRPLLAACAGGLIALGASAITIIKRAIDNLSNMYIETSLKNDLADLEESFQSPGGFWLAEVNGHIAGMVGLVVGKPDRGAGELKRMAVMGQYRRLRIGSLLVETLLQHARAHGIHTVSLGTSLAQPAAISFYQRLGFRIVDRSEVGLWDNQYRKATDRKPWFYVTGLGLVTLEIKVADYKSG